MLRARITDALKEAMKAKDQIRVSTIRLINAALKDRDIQAREKGNHDGLGDQEILSLLQSMVKQRRDSIEAYEAGDRHDLARQEAAEIAVIEEFLPKQMDAEEVAAAVAKAIEDTGAATIKDMGKVMGFLKQEFPGRMDFGKASAMVKERLG